MRRLHRARAVARHRRPDVAPDHAPPRRRAVRRRRVLRGRRATATRPRSGGGSRGTRLGFGDPRSRILSSTRRPQPDLFLGSGDRLEAILGGLAFGVGRDRSVAVGFAPLRYHRLRFPDVCVVSGRAAQLDRDRVHRRGHVPRRAPRPAARRPASNPTLANLTQALALRADDAARRARPRPLPARPDARHRPVRRLADGRHRRHRGRVPRPRHHPVRGLPVAPATPARRKPRGREVEEIEKRRRPPEGWRVIGSREPARRRDRLTRRPGRRHAARPPVALYVHVPFCVSLCPYCDFVVVRRARRLADRAPGSTAFLDGAPGGARRCGPTPLTPRSAPVAGRRSQTVYLGGGTPSLLPADASAASSSASARGSASPTAPRSRSRRTPGPTNAATRRPRGGRA